jgi:hypothetical protein
MPYTAFQPIQCIYGREPFPVVVISARLEKALCGIERSIAPS